MEGCIVQIGDNVAISVHFSADQENIIADYAAARGITVSEAVRIAILEKIENEHDLDLAKKALAEWEKDGKKVYTLEEVGRDLGFL